ncbi:hypothetical protein [Methylorubrum extorquens]|uniref:hypothetical protein n=1 Tax=Methylorubrum extorquens TaxID=408 RepID=UPI000158FAB2|nr:hypothetical protein [Methylorubrum extorquens]ABY28683.1 hypothetical protein Mext_0259 [Methylorubrum extorquens PA1]KQP85773.1 hypothetical protein ASF55_15640 [Methylobacterium sp. Leaf119]WIU40063.1 hypothetical protein KQ926_01395 [Methylorubrum extorquens]
MPIWTESECETFFADGKPSATEPCQVRIADGRIVVDARGANGGWMYEGEEVGPDHFQLTSPARAGTATLHRFERDSLLDGGWREGAAYGMWRITLGQSEAD